MINRLLKGTILGAVLLGAVALAPQAHAGNSRTNTPTTTRGLPDLSPAYEEGSFTITQRLGGNTLEFGVFTVNVGGRDWRRPLRAGVTTCQSSARDFRIDNLYHYTLFNQTGTDPAGEPIWTVVSETDKPTICTIDNGRADPALACIQDGRTVGQFTCSCNQGISRGWSDSYFRGLTGQWVLIGSATGNFMLAGELDPAFVLQDADVPDDGADASHDNNYAYAFFSWDGMRGTAPSHTNGTIVDGFEASAVCPGP